MFIIIIMLFKNNKTKQKKIQKQTDKQLVVIFEIFLQIFQLVPKTTRTTNTLFLAILLYNVNLKQINNK